MTNYYYISSTQNKKSILKNGVINYDSEILITTNLETAPLIAGNQLFNNRYSVYLINEKAFESDIIKDDVSELGSEYQFFVNQQTINPKYVTFIKDEIWNQWELVEHCILAGNRKFGLPDDYIHFNVSLHSEWCEYYNKKYKTNIIHLK